MSLEVIEPTGNPELVLADFKDTLRVFEQQFSRFKTSSLISQLNQGETVLLTPELKALINVAKGLSAQTNQRFNPHVNAAAVGYEASFTEQNFTPAKTVAPAPPFPDGLIVEGSTVRLHPGMVLDFGGFLKGYLSQFLAEKHQTAGKGILVNLGGDLTVRGEDSDRPDFAIGIYNPITQQEVIVKLRNQSLSTSGTYKRRWEKEGQTYHHVLDARDHQSAESEFISVSLWGPFGAEVDALATAFFSANETERQQWVGQNPGLSSLTINQSGIVEKNL